jgi:hypothetical protein
MAEGPVVTFTQNAWSKVATGVVKGIDLSVPELTLIDNIADFDAPYSFRENRMVLDLNEDGGVATIGEGDYEAEESSIDLEEGFLDISHFNARFNLSNLVKYVQRGAQNQLENDLTFRATKKVDAMASHVGDYFYGSKTAVLALCDLNVTGATTLTLTLYAGYGNTAITDPKYLASKFKPQVNGKGGDVVALVNSSSLVASSFGRVTARNLTAGTLTVAVISGSVTVNATGLKVVKANSKGRTTIAHTDYNRGLAGIQDILFGSSYHSLTHANWVPVFVNSTTGRFTFADLLRADSEIGLNASMDAKADVVLIDPAVWRDAIAYERAAVRYASADNLSMDGALKTPGRRIFESKRVPPGWAIPFNKRGLKKWEFTTQHEGKPTWAQGKEYIDLSGMVFRIERVLGLVVVNRLMFSGFTNRQRAA